MKSTFTFALLFVFFLGFCSVDTSSESNGGDSSPQSNGSSESRDIDELPCNNKKFPCQNGGTCEKKAQKNACNCPAEYTGHFCETRVNCTGDYNNWSPCSETCGDGTQMRTFVISENGTMCPQCVSPDGMGGCNPETRSCNEGTCVTETCGTISGTTIGSPINSDRGFCGTSTTAAETVYHLSTSNSEDVTLSTCNAADYDTKISVFEILLSGTQCVAGRDDAAGCAGFTTELTFKSMAGSSYEVVVHGFGGASGNFDLTITCTGCTCSGPV